MIINARASEWRTLKAGNKLTLTDEPACLLATEGKTYPIIGTVKEITKITEANQLAEWLLFTLVETPVFVMAKLVGDAVKVTLLRESPLWKTAKRSELVNHADAALDALCLFSPPPDVDAFLAGSVPQRIQWVQRLNFAGFFERNAIAGDGQEWKYVQRGDKEFHGAVSFSPPHCGADQMATISEYGADTAGVPDPELVVLEMGSKANGLIRVLTGAEMSCDTIIVK